MSLVPALVAAAILAGCVTTRSDPAASPRAGCEVTGGHWRSATQTCDKH
jgi:hypothetical protein